jgi:hypothetical protein
VKSFYFKLKVFRSRQFSFIKNILKEFEVEFYEEFEVEFYLKLKLILPIITYLTYICLGNYIKLIFLGDFSLGQR